MPRLPTRMDFILISLGLITMNLLITSAFIVHEISLFQWAIANGLSAGCMLPAVVLAILVGEDK